MNSLQTHTADSVGYEVLEPCGRAARSVALRAPFAVLGKPAALLYRAVSGQIRRRRIIGRPQPWGDTTVLSVGNLEIGGNGKTPLAIHLLQYLEQKDERPVYISRGFGSTAESLDAVTVFASWADGRWPTPADGLRWIPREDRAGADEIGDEGAVVAMRCPTTPLVFSRDKLRAIELAREMFRPSHIILDDAFQSWGVPRDRDIVLLDAEHPLGNGHVLPAGTLREDPTALARANWIGINGCEATSPPLRYAEMVQAACGRTLPVFGIVRKLALDDAIEGGAARRVEDGLAALSSIARPQRFERELNGNAGGLELAIRFPDHYRYRAADIATIRRALAGRHIRNLVTTEKDWVKLREFDLSFARVLVGRLELAVEDSILQDLTRKPQALPAASP